MLWLGREREIEIEKERDEKGEKEFKKAIALLNKECPREKCKWCEKVSVE